MGCDVRRPIRHGVENIKSKERHESSTISAINLPCASRRQSRIGHKLAERFRGIDSVMHHVQLAVFSLVMAKDSSIQSHLLTVDVVR
jgi:hypothetical protein